MHAKALHAAALCLIGSTGCYRTNARARGDAGPVDAASQDVGPRDASTSGTLSLTPCGSFGHTAARLVARSPDGRTIATAEMDVVELYDAFTGVHRLTTASDSDARAALALEFTPDGSSVWLVSPTTARRFRVSDGIEERQLAVGRGSDLPSAAEVRGNRLALVRPTAVELLDLDSGARRELPGLSGPFALSPDGTRLALSEPAAVRVLGLPFGEELARVSVQSTTALSFSRSNDLAILDGGTGTMLVTVLRADSSLVGVSMFTTDASPRGAVTWGASGSLAVLVDDHLETFDSSLRRLHTFDASSLPTHDAITDLVAEDDQVWLAAGDLWSVVRDDVQWAQVGTATGPLALDGMQRVVRGGAVWELATGLLARRLGPRGTLSALSPDGRVLAYLSETEGVFELEGRPQPLLRPVSAPTALDVTDEHIILADATSVTVLRISDRNVQRFDSDAPRRPDFIAGGRDAVAVIEADALVLRSFEGRELARTTSGEPRGYSPTVQMADGSWLAALYAVPLMAIRGGVVSSSDRSSATWARALARSPAGRVALRTERGLEVFEESSSARAFLLQPRETTADRASLTIAPEGDRVVFVDRGPSADIVCVGR